MGAGVKIRRVWSREKDWDMNKAEGGAWSDERTSNGREYESKRDLNDKKEGRER